MAMETVGLPRSRTWLEAVPGLAMVCVVGALYTYSMTPHGSRDAGFLIGYHLPGAMILGALYYFATKSYRLPGLGLAGFACIYATMIFTSYTAYRYEAHQAATVAAEISRVVDSFPKRPTTGNAAAPKPALPASPSPSIETKATGDFAAISLWMQSIMADSKQFWINYQSKLTEDGWIKLLSPKRIADDPYFTESDAIVSRAQATVAKFKKLHTVRQASYAAAMAALPVSDSTKQEMVDGYNAKKSQNEALVAEFWRAEDAVLDSFGNVIAFLKKTRGTWQIKGNQVLFVNTADMKTYNRLLDNVHTTAAAETTAMEKQSASIKRTLSDLSKL